VGVLTGIDRSGSEYTLWGLFWTIGKGLKKGEGWAHEWLLGKEDPKRTREPAESKVAQANVL